MTSRTSDEWLADLRVADDRRESALADLRAIILRGLPFALAGKLSPDNPAFEALTQDVTQETLLKVLAHLDTFEGRSLFTTWVQKIAVREALGELKRRRWRDVPLPEMAESGESDAPMREMADPAPRPEALAERNDLLQRFNRMVSEELTGKQRRVVELLALQGLSVEAAAGQLQIKPNALYKLMFDARARLRKRLEREGLTPAQILSVFEGGAG
ncbi:MAG: RNA polymerase sigma factor [Anaerolineae bacterium]|nr:RNA polymerase sigma factor [Anaerolineae bacterium]